MDDKDKIWYDALVKKGHTPFMTSRGDLDMFLYEDGIHNGPGCTKCLWSFCIEHHCDNIDKIPVCPEKDAPIQLEFDFT